MHFASLVLALTVSTATLANGIDPHSTTTLIHTTGPLTTLTHSSTHSSSTTPIHSVMTAIRRAPYHYGATFMGLNGATEASDYLTSEPVATIAGKFLL